MSKKTFNELQVGDIIFCAYPNADGSFKSRPLIVMKKIKPNKIVVGYLTSVKQKKHYLGNYKLKYWKEAGLKEPSTFKANGLREVNIDKVDYWGHIHHEDFIKIGQSIKLYIGKNNTQNLNKEINEVKNLYPKIKR